MQRTALKLFRVRRGMSQEKMARTLGYSRNHYANIENGTQGVTLKFLDALCETFSMTLLEAKELTKLEKEKDHATD